jgi:hypothetical protein
MVLAEQSEFNESRILAFIIFNIAVLSILGVPVLLLLEDNLTASYVVSSLLIILEVAVTTGALVGSKFWFIYFVEGTANRTALEDEKRKAQGLSGQHASHERASDALARTQHTGGGSPPQTPTPSSTSNVAIAESPFAGQRPSSDSHANRMEVEMTPVPSSAPIASRLASMTTATTTEPFDHLDDHKVESTTTDGEYQSRMRQPSAASQAVATSTGPTAMDLVRAQSRGLIRSTTPLVVQNQHDPDMDTIINV